MLSKKGILVRRNDFTTCKLVSQLVYKVLYRVAEGSFEIHDNRAVGVDFRANPLNLDLGALIPDLRS